MDSLKNALETLEKAREEAVPIRNAEDARNYLIAKPSDLSDPYDKAIAEVFPEAKTQDGLRTVIKAIESLTLEPIIKAEEGFLYLRNGHRIGRGLDGGDDWECRCVILRDEFYNEIGRKEYHNVGPGGM